MQGILPVAGGLMLWFLGGWSMWLDYDVATANDFTMWTVPGIHWQIGGAFVIAVVAALVGVPVLPVLRYHQPGLLQEGDADPGHADAGPGRVASGRPGRGPGPAAVPPPAVGGSA